MSEFQTLTDRLASDVSGLISRILETDPELEELAAQVQAAPIPAATKRVMVAAIHKSESERRVALLRTFGDSLASSLKGIGLRVEYRPARRRRTKRGTATQEAKPGPPGCNDASASVSPLPGERENQ